MHLRAGEKELRAQRESGHRAAAALCADEMVKAHPLTRDLLRAGDVAERAERVRAAAGNLVVRHAERFSHAVHLRVNVVVAVRVQKAHVRAHQMLQQLVAASGGHAALLQNQDRLHAEPVCRRGREHRVIRLRAAGREDDLGALRHRVREQKLQLAHLVAAEPESGQIVPLEIHVRAEPAAHVLQLLDRRREQSQRRARKVLQLFQRKNLLFHSHRSILPRGSRPRNLAFGPKSKYIDLRKRIE